MPAGYSLTEPTVVGDLTLFPRSFRWHSDTVGVEEETLVNTTNGGVITEYSLFNRDVLPRIVFRFPKEEYVSFKAFIDATRALEFWFVPDSATMATKVNVRRKPSFIPPNVGQPGVFGSSMQQWFDGTIELIGLVADQPLLD